MNIFKKFRAKQLNKKGMNLMMKGNLKKAYSILQKAVFLDNSFEILFNLGLVLNAMNRNNEAEFYFRKILETNPDSEVTLLALMETLSMQLKWEEANQILRELNNKFQNKSVYKKYLRRNTDVIKREKYVLQRKLFNEAQMNANENNFQKSLEILERALEIDPSNAEILNNIGSTKLRLGKPIEEVLPYFKKASELDPTNQKYLENLAFVARKKKK